MNQEIGQLYNSIFIELLKKLPSLIISLWPLWILISLMSGIKLVEYYSKLYRYNKAGLKDIDAMSGEDFEKFLVNLFEKFGYGVEHIGKLGDYGGDLIIKKDGVKTIVQAKRQKSKVKESAVQQAISAKAYYHCDHAMVVTNSYYYRHAWNLGKQTGTTLWTRKDLTDAILKSK